MGNSPSQVELANEVFTPSEQAIENAKGIISAMEDAEAKGAGAAVLKGKLIDIASIKQAKVLIDQHNKIKKYKLMTVYLDFEKDLAEVQSKIADLETLPDSSTVRI